MDNSNISKIKDAFKDNAWAYTVMHHGVAIGLWDSAKGEIKFHHSAGFSWDYVTELRVFNCRRELRFIRNEDDTLVSRDTLELESRISKDDKDNTSYLMYGTDISHEEHSGMLWTALKEDRGGKLYFPKELVFKDEPILMWLNIRNYLQIAKTSVGGVRLEVCDYAFTGFSKGRKKEGVTLNA